MCAALLVSRAHRKIFLLLEVLTTYRWVLLSYRYLSPPIVHASTSTSDTHAGLEAKEQDLTSSSIARLSESHETSQSTTKFTTLKGTLHLVTQMAAMTLSVQSQKLTQSTARNCVHVRRSIHPTKAVKTTLEKSYKDESFFPVSNVLSAPPTPQHKHGVALSPHMLAVMRVSEIV